jgi:hypothetical protein
VDRNGRRLRQRCESLVAGLALPRPFDATEFVATLARDRGRPIDLVPMTVGSAAPCGMIASTSRAEYILYPTNTTGLHQRHILFHEVGHLLCEHRGSGALDAATARALLPHLSIDLVRRVLGRTVYDEEQEREAELIASLLSRRVAREDRPARRRERAGGLAQLGSVFEPGEWGRRDD